MIIAALLVAAFALAYANGSNDNFKGVATLWGSGRLGYRPALALATGATLLGSLAAVVDGSALAASFSGKGLVPDAITSDPRFAFAVGGGAAFAVLAASRLGFPVSTTHALIGALVGAGLVWVDGAVNVTRLGAAFVAPLLVSPILASGLAVTNYPLLRRGARRMGLTPTVCVCAGAACADPVPVAGATLARLAPVLTIIADEREVCEAHLGTGAAILDGAALRDGTHVLSAAAVSFARGLNDTPKIAALLLVAPALALATGGATLALAIAAGGLLGARRVAVTMSHGITTLSEGQGLVANLTTAVVVLGASRLGLPVSTTHVSCGALFGIGAATGRARLGTITQIVAAWVTTLPAGAIAAALLALAVGAGR
ncbi:MAG: inorganic phosphate transporter [Deltaproteobacteria bacterium]|nr:inorganic phosphate transporter [Deltaproteobacteria bacterium]